MAALTTQRSGNWSDTNAGTMPWTALTGSGTGGVPGAGDTVTVSSGHTLTVDGTQTVGTAGPTTYGVAAPTVSPTTGGTLTSMPSGNYFVHIVPVDGSNVEGSASPESAQLSLTNGVSTPRITLPSLPAGATSWSIYITSAGTAAASITHRRYATGQSAGNFEPVSASWENGTVAFASAKLIATASAIRAVGTLALTGSLTANGDIYTSGSSGITMAAGSSLTFNVGSGLTYGLRNGVIYGQLSPLVTSGTSGSHCTITKTGSGTALLGMTSFDGCGTVQASYTDFSNLGTASVNAITSLYLVSPARTISYADCTFDNCGLVSATGMGANETFDLQRCRWTNSLHSTSCINQTTIQTRSSGTRRVINCAFDKRCTVDGRQFTIEDNYFRGSMYPASQDVSTGLQWTSFRHNFVCQKFLRGATDRMPYDISDCIFFIDSSAIVNPHPWDPAVVNQDSTWSGIVFDGINADNSGDLLLLKDSAPGASNYTFTITNSLFLPNILGDNLGTPLTAYGNAKLKWIFDHNTYCMGIQGVSYAESGGYVGYAGMCPSFRSNIAWNPVKTTQGWVLWDALTGQAFDAAAGYFTSGNVDYNGKYNYSTTGYSSSWDTAALARGYAAGSSAGANYPFGVGVVPGDHDVDANPQFVDRTRCLAVFDQQYLSKPAGTAWANSVPYTVGMIVSSQTPGVYNGQNINYRCTQAHTSSSGDINLGQPGLGTAGIGNTKNWHNYWELASQYWIRESILTGSTYTDAALGVTSKSMIEIARAWLRAGFAPQNTLYKNAGHDGVTIGAVEAPAASKPKSQTLSLSLGLSL